MNTYTTNVTFLTLKVNFMELKSTISCTQEISTDPYSEPDKSNPYKPSTILKIHFNTSPLLYLSVPSGLFRSCFTSTVLNALFFSPFVLYALFI